MDSQIQRKEIAMNYGYRWACWGMVFVALLLLISLHRLDLLVVLIPASLLLAWAVCPDRRTNRIR